MNLREKQSLFVKLLWRLLRTAEHLDYEVTLGEAYRTKQQAEWNAEQGVGIANSVHCQRLAVDLNLFKHGRLLSATEDYAELGAQWKMLDQLCRWGGDFAKPDGGHFSLWHGGRA